MARTIIVRNQNSNNGNDVLRSSQEIIQNQLKSNGKMIKNRRIVDNDRLKSRNQIVEEKLANNYVPRRRKIVPTQMEQECIQRQYNRENKQIEELRNQVNLLTQMLINKENEKVQEQQEVVDATSIRMAVKKIMEEFKIEVNSKDSSKKIMNDMKIAIEGIEELIEYSDYIQADKVEIVSTICKWFNIQIVCYTTGLRITGWRKNRKTGDQYPVFGICFKIFDSMKDTQDICVLTELVIRIKKFAKECFNVDISETERLFNKKQWLNVQKIQSFCTDIIENMEYMIISPESISDLKDAKDKAWFEVITGACLLLLVILSMVGLILYKTNAQFRKNIDDAINYYGNGNRVVNIQG